MIENSYAHIEVFHLLFNLTIGFEKKEED